MGKDAVFASQRNHVSKSAEGHEIQHYLRDVAARGGGVNGPADLWDNGVNGQDRGLDTVCRALGVRLRLYSAAAGRCRAPNSLTRSILLALSCSTLRSVSPFAPWKPMLISPFRKPGRMAASPL